MSGGISFKKFDGSKLKVGVVKARWNSHITDALLAGCKQALKDSRVKDKNVIVVEVPGSFELPFAAKSLIAKQKLDAIVALGAVIKGGTPHDEYINNAVANGIREVGQETGVPVIFGVLTCTTEAQAVERSTGENNHGYWWAMSAIEMALL